MHCYRIWFYYREEDKETTRAILLDAEDRNDIYRQLKERDDYKDMIILSFTPLDHKPVCVGCDQEVERTFYHSKRDAYYCEDCLKILEVEPDVN